MNAKNLLLKEISRVQVMKTSDVLRWGLENFSNRADRNMRDLAADGYVRRMSDVEKEHRFGHIKEDVWIFEKKVVEKQLEFQT